MAVRPSQEHNDANNGKNGIHIANYMTGNHNNDDNDALMKEKEEENVEGFNLALEAWLLFKIAIPAVAVQFSVLFIVPQTSSFVGRNLGTEELAGFSLGSLTGNMTILSVMWGALTAADTLMPRAFGIKQYHEVGRLAIRSFIMCTLLLLPPIVPLVTAMNWIFDKLGQDPVASALASKWIIAYLFGIPAMLMFRVAQSFLNAQDVVNPLVVASVFSCFVIHPIILNIFVPAYGFVGSGIAVTITQTIMAILVFIYCFIKPEHHPQTWPGLSRAFIMDSIRMGPLLEFFKLGLGGVLTLSEWWFWECVCFIVGSFGVVPLCVHTIGYNLVPLLFMIPLGICIGQVVRMGNVLAYDVPKAKTIAYYCMIFTTILGVIVSMTLYFLRIPIARLFTSDPEVLQGCVDIWPKLCIFIFIFHIFGINTAILRALGMQWRMAAIIFVCLWCLTLPTILYVAVYRGGGIDAVWTILPIFYTFMQIALIFSYTTVDWEEIGLSIREQGKVSTDMATADGGINGASESTGLLV